MTKCILQNNNTILEKATSDVLYRLQIRSPLRRHVRHIGSDCRKSSMIPIAIKNYFLLRPDGNACNERKAEVLTQRICKTPMDATAEPAQK